MICNEAERQKLYDEVWAEPMTVVAKRYNLSDNGLRKRCRAWGIPLPPFGYWAKKQNNKPVAERPPLPPLAQVIRESAADDKITFTFDGADKVLFAEWCSTRKVSSPIKQFDTLIENHITEMAAREKSAKNAFVEELPVADRWQLNLEYPRPKSVVSIVVSKANRKRAYHFMHAFFQCIRQIHGEISVPWGDTDNTTIRIDFLKFQCSLIEQKTKRRDLGMDSNSMRPVYEEIYNGLLELTIEETENCYAAGGPQPLRLSYCDQQDNPLENQLGRIFEDIYSYISALKIEYTKKQAEREARWAEELRLKQEKQEAARAQRMKEEHKRKQGELFALANQHMSAWRKAADLRDFLSELRQYAESLTAEEQQKIQHYCKEVEGCIKDKNTFIEEILQSVDRIGG